MINDIVTALISPLGTALVLWSLSLILLAFAPGDSDGESRISRRGSKANRWIRASRMLGVLGFSWLLVWSLPVASDSLRGAIENQAGPREISALPTQPVAVVLGGGVSGPRPPQRPDPDLNAAADRLWHAARLYHAGKAKQLLLSGGTMRTGDGSEAEAMRQVLLDLGVPEKAIWLEDASVNTASNAERTAKLLREKKIASVLLVTSALHMPRARAAFERAGITVHTAPTDFEVIPVAMGLYRVLPDAGALLGSSRGMKEIVGRWVSR